ncbi:MAG: S8 family serine peptidase, partial [Dactylosporangium sp.]|nr:S8 family serine peptidase [Dactylosporangium sp.]
MTPTPAADAKPTAGPEWGVANIEAPRVWSEFDVRGEGIVVANIDGGVQYDHPALVGKYRGNLGGGQFDHNYNWFDPSHVCPSPAPCDGDGHGTHTMGTMVGDDGAGNQIGVAPDATWFAARGCESNTCSEFALLASGQFVLAPTDLSGNNPRPDLRADIVNNSWGGPSDDLWYQETIRAWVAAGMFPAFAVGNDGPACNTANSPGDNPEAYAVGGYDINNAIYTNSSRGPGIGTEIKPDISAPAVAVRSSVINSGYASFTGTSMATPHVAGTVALIWSANPALKGDVEATKALLDATAIDVDSTGCGGTAANNNNFGEGRLNAYAAVNAGQPAAAGRVEGIVTNASSGAPMADLRITSGAASVLTGPDGRYSLRLPAGVHTVTASR